MYTHLIHGSNISLSHPKRHLDRFSRFYMAHPCNNTDRQTDRQADHARCNITTSVAAQLRQQNVNSKRLNQWEPSTFDPPFPQNRRNLTDCQKLSQEIKFKTSTAMQNLVEIRPMGVTGQVGEI